MIRRAISFNGEDQLTGLIGMNDRKVDSVTRGPILRDNLETSAFQPVLDCELERIEFVLLMLFKLRSP